MPKPPVKKIVGVKYKRTPGEVVKPGGPSSVEQSVTRGHYKKTYTPEGVETGDPRYGKVGKGGYQPMVKAIAKAQAQKRDVTDFVPLPGGGEGTYKAGTTKIEEGPPTLHTKLNVNPRITKVKDTFTPIYKTETGQRQNFGKAKKRRLPHVDYLERIKRNKRTEAGHGR